MSPKNRSTRRAFGRRRGSSPSRLKRAAHEREARRRARATREIERLAVLLRYERPLWESGLRHIAGVDEVGVGPLAGPVVAAAVILEPHALIFGINDSKKLAPRRRDEIAAKIREQAVAIGIGVSHVEEIDRLNILEASLLAMSRAVGALSVVPEHLLVDARTVPGVDMPQRGIIHGDAQSESIAAASIIAKVFRDDLMAELAVTYPGYGFEVHKGYPTRAHLERLSALGPCAIHRRSFGPVKRAGSTASRTGSACELLVGRTFCARPCVDRG